MSTRGRVITLFALCLGVGVAAYAGGDHYFSLNWSCPHETTHWSDFTGYNINVSLEAHSTGSANYTVSLYRDVAWWFDDYIGDIPGGALRNGTTTYQWSNVGSGAYYLLIDPNCGPNVVIDNNDGRIWMN
jgi:hypothetical protein